MSDFIDIFKYLVDSVRYWTVSEKCVTYHNSACCKIFRLCELPIILWYIQVHCIGLYIVFLEYSSVTICGILCKARVKIIHQILDHPTVSCGSFSLVRKL